MKFVYTILYTALCFASGLAGDIGPVSSSVLIGELDPLYETLTSEDITASTNVIGLLEYIRRLMPVGINMFIPPTDPYKAASIPDAVFDNPNSKMQGTVQLLNLVAVGASDFVIKKLDVRLNNNRVDFHISVPKIEAEIDYHADQFRYGPLVLDTSGHLKLTLEDLNMEGTFCVGPLIFHSNKRRLTVVGLDVDTNITYVKVDADTSTVPAEVIKEINDVLAVSLAQAAVGELNSVLINLKPEQIRQILLA